MDYPGEKLIIRMWETLAEKGVGGLLAPWQARRMFRVSVEGKAHELLVLAQASSDAEAIKRGEVLVTADGGIRRLSGSSASSTQDQAPLEETSPLLQMERLRLADSVRREVNTARALLIAEEVLESDEQKAPDAKVGADWLHRWRDYAGEVSTEELQSIWGQLLAGEIKSPGTYSLRTMEFLRNTSTSEAVLIERLGSFLVRDMVLRSADDLLKDAGLGFNQLLALQSLGILAGVESVGLTRKLQSGLGGEKRVLATYDDKVILYSPKVPGSTLTLPAYLITPLGKEVLKLVRAKPNTAYFRLLCETAKKQGFNISIAKLQEEDDTNVTATDEEPFE